MKKGFSGIYGLIAAANTGMLSVYDAGAYDADLERCFDELRHCRADFREGGRMAWGAAHGHDDHAVSLALCLRAAQSLGAPRVAVGRRGGP